jgi:phenylpropionate dioxygenase-like ring-hydroxylating dioxygenase large terminal subunit
MSRLFETLEPEAAADRFGRGPVSAAPYYDKQWYADEIEAIFKRSWLHVGHVCEIPDTGSYIRRDLTFARAPLLIVRGRDGAVRTFYNVCTHRGTQLVEDQAGKNSQFSCPYHRWTFGTDGALLSAPDFDRFSVAKADCALKQVQTEVLGGLIFVNLDPHPAQSVRDHFGILAQQFDWLPTGQATHMTQFSYEIEANWKIHFDNFQENYHLKFIHPRTGAMAVGPENPMGYPTHYGFSGPHRGQTLWKNPCPPPLPALLQVVGDRSAALPQPYAATFEKVDMKLFPALHVVWLSPDTVFTHTHMPGGPSRTRSTVRIYWNGEAESASRAFVREFAAMSLRDVLSEDRDAVQAAQLGISSGVLNQINLQDHEVLLRHSHQQVVQRVMAWREAQEPNRAPL